MNEAELLSAIGASGMVKKKLGTGIPGEQMLRLINRLEVLEKRVAFLYEDQSVCLAEIEAIEPKDEPKEGKKRGRPKMNRIGVVQI